MPSAENATSEVEKLESPPPNEPKQVENLKGENAEEKVSAIQQVISIISNKVRNLEKRKNKLDGYAKDEKDGKTLTSEQEKAVSKYDEVVQQLSLSKELQKSFNSIASAASKDFKREARKNLFTRQLQETLKVREVLMIQELLRQLRDEKVRSDFLYKRNGACAVAKAEMDFIDAFEKHVIPTRPKFSNEATFANSAKTSADHFSFLIDARNRQFLDTGFTYEKAKELFNRIQSCGYWEKDVKYVEVTEESRADNDSPNSEDLEGKDEKAEDDASSISVAAPTPAQVPAPTFNGNLKQTSARAHHTATRVPQNQSAQLPPQNAPINMKTAASVENAYFNQIKYSQPPAPLVPIPQPTAAPNFQFFCDSEIDSPGNAGSQQPGNVIHNVNQSKHSQAQQQHTPTQGFKNPNFHPSPMASGQMYPPGFTPPSVQTLQNPSSHIPVNYQPSPQQQTQQNAVSSPQVTNMIPKQQQHKVNGNQGAGFGNALSQTPPLQNASRASAYPATPNKQYQQQLLSNKNLHNAKPHEQQKSVVTPKQDVSGEPMDDGRNVQDKDKNRDDYQQQPQIDTWTNETAAQSGGNTFPPRSSGGANQRNNRSSGGAKYNNYRNQTTRPYNENGNGDSHRETPASGTFFRNNERFNGSTASGGRFENNARGGTAKPREEARGGNYRAGSGRFAGSTSAQGSSNSGQRK